MATVYVTNEYSGGVGESPGTVSVINTATNTVSATILVGGAPLGVEVSSDGSKVYVANENSNSISVIATTANTISATIPVGAGPIAFGLFIQPAQPTLPAPKFAGTPGRTNCRGQSVSALAQQYGGLPAAATALHYSSVQMLQNAIAEYCAA